MRATTGSLAALALGLFASSLLWARDDAPGAPGGKATWTNGNKQGVGTSVTVDSKVWFTLGDGALTELYYPTLDMAQTRLLELLVADDHGLLERETVDTEHRIRIPDPRALAFEQINTSRTGRYRIYKTVVTDPARPVVRMRVRFEPLTPGPLRVFVFFDPAVANGGGGDRGSAGDGTLVAEDGDHAVAVVSSPGFAWTNTGYLGTSDGLAALRSRTPFPVYRRSGRGNVAQMAEVPLAEGGGSFSVAVGFGRSAAAAVRESHASLGVPFDDVFGAYARGWSDYVGRLRSVRPKYADAYAMAAMILRAHEDKTYRGAMIASLSVPWGHEADASRPGVGGYHLVWARDLYQVATAQMAMGDPEAAARALGYLFDVQQRRDGSFPQNSWLDGRPYWRSLQLDEVAFPLVLAQQLGRTDAVTYDRHVRPAAEFLMKRGPSTPQERWEEEEGYSPSTIAAEIAGLVSAAAIAEANADAAAAARYRKTADAWAARIESWTVTRTGPHGPGPYFLRLSRKGHPDAGEVLHINNGGGRFDERSIVDAGFLELVRLGIRPASDPLILSSLAVVDRVIRVETPKGPAWYRYNHDGYGEKPNGRGYDGTGVGRLWPLLTGERGEYELAAGRDATRYLDALLAFASDSLMFPEQVWDRPESPLPSLGFGQGTGSATPLAWSCAQFIRLARGIEEGRVLGTADVVKAHFSKKPAGR